MGSYMAQETGLLEFQLHDGEVSYYTKGWLNSIWEYLTESDSIELIRKDGLVPCPFRFAGD